MRWTIWAAALAAAAAASGPATAAPAAGAPQDMGMTPGGWGPGGWQSGDAPAVPPMAADAPPMAHGYAPPPPMAQGYGAPMAPGYGAPMGGMGPMGAAPPMVVRHSDFRPLRPGQKLPSRWADPALVVRDPARWGLGRPGPEMRWIRYYDDAVMVDPDRRVVTERGPILWDRPRAAMRRPVYPPMLPPGHPPIGAEAYPAPYPRDESYSPAPGTVVTTHVEPIAPPAVYGMPYGGGTVVSVTPGTVTTTTVTTEHTAYRSVRVARPVHRVVRRGKLLRRD